MLNIDEDQLKLLLEKKRKKLERPKYSGIGEIISGISIIITLSLADFSYVEFMKPLHFKILSWITSIIILVYGIYVFVKSIVDSFTTTQLYNEIANLDPLNEHPFNIIIVRDNNRGGKYLVFRSKRWSCWLFPNYHCLNGIFSKTKELKNIKERLSRDLNISDEIHIKYLGNEISEKFSISDKVSKRYNFHYFQVADVVIECGKRNTFYCNGKRYCWKTLDQLYSNKNILKKNKDVLDFIRHMCDVS